MKLEFFRRRLDMFREFGLEPRAVHLSAAAAAEFHSDIMTSPTPLTYFGYAKLDQRTGDDPHWVGMFDEVDIYDDVLLPGECPRWELSERKGD